ncbi:hypothetical protein [Methylobacterium iners]|uniref:Uncharacterized protein n=1 Tax=Methylobacterium iners TaxID=418707 RepID=A0ABQ4RZI3_9HYPH|nr:hypothetical protein [Methylobacterium iners]GJD96261.1 hypothetical protein OCOJLMKI_3481 [Methylobacterium iners]
MERLCDLRSRKLVITCSVCKRRGEYNMDRLRRRFGEHADIMNVYLALTQTCRWQREPGRRTPNVYGIGCHAKFDLPADTGRGSLPSRT